MRTAVSSMVLLLLVSSPALAQNSEAPQLVPAQGRPAVLPEQASPPAQSSPTPSQSDGQPSEQRFGQASQDNRAGDEAGPREASTIPIIGARRLLNSLADLDRPLTPEEITAYGAAIQSQMPLSPSLIRDYRRRVDDSQKAAAEPPSGRRARPISDSIRISLKADGQMSTLYSTPNTVSVMAFYDRTGKAWPIASYVVGKADTFQVYALQEGSNQLAVTPLQTHGYSNLIVSLVEEDRPIVVNLETSADQTNYRRDITVEGLGPNAEVSPTTVSTRTPPSDGIMMAFAQGAALPRGAVPLRSSDPELDAWNYKDEMYIRTSNTLISPSWSAALTGPGAIHAYRLKQTPIALISRDGAVTRVRISQ